MTLSKIITSQLSITEFNWSTTDRMLLVDDQLFKPVEIKLWFKERILTCTLLDH